MKELRAAVGLSWEHFEDVCEFLGENPPLGLAVQRYGDELRLVTAPEVSSSVERHLNQPRPVPLSSAALEELAIVAYRQPIARSGIEYIRGSAGDSAIATLLENIRFQVHHRRAPPRHPTTWPATPGSRFDITDPSQTYHSDGVVSRGPVG